MQIIPDSELILNEDGSVYHLNLLPSDLAEIVINVGDPDRVPMVSRFFQSIEIRKQKREFVTHTGTYKGKRMTVLSTGIGTDNIDIVYNELDALVNIDLKKKIVREKPLSLTLVRIGTSGSLQDDIPVDAAVCSEFGLGLDGLLHFYKHVHTPEEHILVDDFRKHFPSNGIFPDAYICRSPGDINKFLGGDMIQGITASCSGFYAPQGRQLRFELARPDFIERLHSFHSGTYRITNFEMETSAMYGLARVLGHRCCSVNAIVANRITNEHTHRGEAVMLELIERVLDKLAVLPVV